VAKSSVFKARLKVVTVLVDRQLYGSEFHTEGLSIHYLSCSFSCLFIAVSAKSKLLSY